MTGRPPAPIVFTMMPLPTTRNLEGLSERDLLAHGDDLFDAWMARQISREEHEILQERVDDALLQLPGRWRQPLS